MSSKAITEKQQDREGPDGFPRMGEAAPSLLRGDDQQWAPWGGAAGPGATVGGLLLGLGFLLAFVRNEKEADYRDAAIYAIGGGGALAALAGFIGGNVSGTFLLPHGVLLALVGVGFLWAFVACRGASDELGS